MCYRCVSAHQKWQKSRICESKAASVAVLLSSFVRDCGSKDPPLFCNRRNREEIDFVVFHVCVVLLPLLFCHHLLHFYDGYSSTQQSFIAAIIHLTHHCMCVCGEFVCRIRAWIDDAHFRVTYRNVLVVRLLSPTTNHTSIGRKMYVCFNFHLKSKCKSFFISSFFIIHWMMFTIISENEDFFSLTKPHFGI